MPTFGPIRSGSPASEYEQLAHDELSKASAIHLGSESHPYPAKSYLYNSGAIERKDQSHLLDSCYLPDIGSGASSIIATTAAWAILYASHQSSQRVDILAPVLGDFVESIQVDVKWDSSIDAFLDQIRSRFEDAVVVTPGSVTPGVSSSSSITDSDSGASTPILSSEKEISQRFIIHVPRGEAGTNDPITLECLVEDRRCSVWAIEHHETPSALAKQLSQQFEYIFKDLCSHEISERPLSDLQAVSTKDLRQIWAWNQNVPRGVDDTCIHDAFFQRVQQHPEAPAVSAHDGELSYQKLDELSTRLALAILEMGIPHQSTILVLIEKSAWVPVAQLAIMKSGCVCSLLDASLPLQRQQVIQNLIQPNVVMTSPECLEQAKLLAPLASSHSLVLSEESSLHWPAARSTRLPRVSPSDWMYIVFTSGSTGTPKGAIISHANYASAVATQSQALDFREFDRVFDFASYAFDATWCNLIHALMVGGCLCIPSDEERKSDLAGALRKYQVNYAVLTPSVAWFPASELPDSLRAFHFGGEPLKAALVKELSTRATVINAYGPAECSTVSTAVVADPEDSADPTIGYGLGCCTWVVKVDGSDLAPIGAVGELWMEGPIVGQGYLREPEKTAATFVKDPEWLERGCMGETLGRRGTLYRSGDLVRYTQDGKLEFVGRKDSQVKIRGQRVELGEIEFHLERALTDEARKNRVQAIAEVIKPDGSDIATLVCVLFIAASPGETIEHAGSLLKQALTGFEERLIHLVPPYMVPSAFFPVEKVPMTPTGKVDRRSLRQQAPAWYWQHLNGRCDSPAEDTDDGAGSELEGQIREVWAQVLNLPPGRISLDAPFTRLGGDSITAMQVVSRCRKRNITIRVADILKLQTIRKIAQSPDTVIILEDRALDENLSSTEEGKSWPLTPIQQIFFDNNPHGENHYTLSYLVKLGRRTSHAELSKILSLLADRHPMLRARFYKDSKTGVWAQQIAPAGITCFDLQWLDFVNQDSMQTTVNERQAGLKLQGHVFAVDVFDTPDDKEPQSLLMSAHHLVMDLVSWRTIWHEMTQFLLGETSLLAPSISFQSWCQLQREEAEQLDPATVLPYQITPANIDYWGVTPGQVPFRDSLLDISVVDEEATKLLLGASNECFGTEILDILVGTLLYSFTQVFRDRKAPALFLETHGREAIDGMDQLDLSEVVGWFTSIFPVEIEGIDTSTCLLDLVKRAKDVRRRVPRNGRSYFASRFHSERGRAAFASHRYAEIIFNYRGSFQQLEDVKSMIRLEDRPNRIVSIPGDGAEYQRPSLVDMNLVVQQGKLQIWTRYHKHMKYQAAIASWIKLYAENLGSVAHTLARNKPSYTMADFPLLRDFSYSGLETLLNTSLAGDGITHENLLDVYPCTPMQEGILISSNVGSATYSTSSIWSVTMPGSVVSAPRLQAAWQTVAQMHSVFCTVFSTNPDTGRYVQIVLKHPNAAIFVDAGSQQDPVVHLGKRQTQEASPGQPPCFFIICVGHDGQVACRLDMNHALMDALSLPIITRDLENAYHGQALTLAPPFRHYIEYIQRTPASVRLAYWRDYLRNISACNLPGDISKSRSKDVSYGWITLPAAATDPVFDVCRREGLTRSTFFHLAWSLVLSFYTGSKEVCFGYISSGRDSAVDGIEDMVGPLINMLIARVDVQQPLKDTAAAVNEYNISHLENQHVSLAEIQHEINLKQLFNSNITVRDGRVPNEHVEEGRMRLNEMSEEDPHEYDLVLSVNMNKAESDVSIQYRTDFASASHMQAIATVLERAITFLAQRVGNTTSRSLHSEFFTHMLGCNEGLALDSWKHQFKDAESASHFPSLPTASHELNMDASASFSIRGIPWLDNFGIESQILAAWALLQSSYHIDTFDVLVGLVPEGASQPRPVRLHINMEDKTPIQTYLEAVALGKETCVKLPALPLQRLGELSTALSFACSFRTVMSITKSSEMTMEAPRLASSPTRALELNFVVNDSHLHVAAQFDATTISMDQMNRTLVQFESVLRGMCSAASTSLALTDLDTASGQDLQTISNFNSEPYEGVQELIHELFQRRVQQMPDAAAICAWDGSLTYRELDELSTRLAHHLLAQGVGPEVIVPVYSEKSVWVPVSVMAIIKANGAGVMIDCTQPFERASSIVEQVSARIILVSRAEGQRGKLFRGVRALIIDRKTLDSLPEPSSGADLPQTVRPDNLLYVSFTSGSTGKPKGAMITHSNFASSIKHQQTALGFKIGQRVYDFASYAFDAAWSNLLHSLTSGSTLCIPSEEQRKNALFESIKGSKATLLNATPSVLRHLDSNGLPDIEQVLMGGEAWAEADFLDWIDNVKLINSYGPGECTIKTTLLQAYRGMVPNTLGTGLGLHTWIVRTDGSERLAPLGSTGELWLEGPQVGRGYIGDIAKTATTYVTRTRWTDGKTCRFYRTGDLVKYGADGHLIFVSRKDSQVKIRGQRTELGEVEHAVQKAMDSCGLKAHAVGEVLKPLNSSNPILVAFLKAEGDRASWETLAEVNEVLADMVPVHMIPTTYIALQDFPMTATGKIHRKSLRDTFTDKTLEDIVSMDACRTSCRQAPRTSSEILLRDLWAEILGIDPSTISAEDSFLRIGGDSLGAMRLVARARKEGIDLSVANVFKQPKLSALAKVVDEQDSSAVAKASLENTVVEPFSLLDSSVSATYARRQAARLCGLREDDIEDVFPCTPLQAGLLAETVRRPGDNILIETWMFKQSIDKGHFSVAWRKMIAANPILRTRIVDLPGHGLAQVVVSHETFHNCQQKIPRDQVFGLGTALMSYEISAKGMTWSIHHALYDGESVPIMFAGLATAYQSGGTIPEAPSFQSFARYLQSSKAEEVEEFWKKEFADFDAQNYPPLPSRTYKPRCNGKFELDINDVASDGDFTAATRIRAAWAILLATITGTRDASFGATVSSREANVPGIEAMTGPTIATVPIRVAVDRTQTVQAMLQQVQVQAADMMPFVQTGIPEIRRFGEDCHQGCQFQSLMVIQPKARSGKKKGEDMLFESFIVHRKEEDVDPFKQFAICLEFILEPSKISLRANYDTTLVSSDQFQRLAERFENILRQVSSPNSRALAVSSLNTSSLADWQQVWSWNAECPEASRNTIHEIFSSVAAAQPEAPAVCSWDGDFTYGEVENNSNRIAHGLLRAGLPQTGQRIVPLFFEKGKWMSTCQLAVMKANGTSVSIDIALPDGRLQTILDLTNPKVILTSAEQESRVRRMAPVDAKVLVVSDDDEFKFLPPREDDALPSVDPDAWLYLVFTSGSTGTPKGAIINHSNFASALRHGQQKMEFGPLTRTFDFVSYAFDVSWLNVLYTLCAGSCLCVPSHSEIQLSPAAAARRRHANTVICTPTVGKLLHDSGIKVVNFGGEVMPREEINYWKQRAQIFHSYGPSECTPVGVTNVLDTANPRVLMGKGLGCATWVVEPDHGKSLSAVGDIGELWLEGPLVGQGYLGEPGKSAAAFYEDPEWLTGGCQGFHPGRTGRLYRTGDLVRYADDGNLEFIGRKDAQIKIRGQRVELDEIAFHVHEAVGRDAVTYVVVDIAKPVDCAKPTLVAFIKLKTGVEIDQKPLFAMARERLAVKVPSYMIPNGYLAVEEIPYTTSGKIDRGKLRKMASVMSRSELLRIDNVIRKAPVTPAEITVHELVGRVLSLESDSFGMESNFIQLGGDSISAMRLVSLAHDEGLFFKVTDILTIGQIAGLVDEQTSQEWEETDMRPYALLHVAEPDTFARDVIMPRVGRMDANLVDVLPVTDMQATYLRNNLCSPRRSWLHSFIDFDCLLDPERLLQSCVDMAELVEIYRTVFVQCGEAFYQAIFDSYRPETRLFSDVDDISTAFDRVVREDTKSPAPLGVPLIHFRLLCGKDKKRARLVFSMSHAIYDALSLRQTMDLLADVHHGRRDSGEQTVDFRRYLTYTASTKSKAYKHWRKTLDGASMTRIACSQRPESPPRVLERAVMVPKGPAGITQATVFTLACASALSFMSRSPDVVFGRVVSGRAGVPSALQNAVGPCLSRMPVRVRFVAGQTKLEQLVELQEQYLQSIAHEAAGLSEIVENCTTWPKQVREFGCWTQYQNVSENPSVDIPGAVGGLSNKERWDIPFAADFLEIFAIPKNGDELSIKMIAGSGYDEGVVEGLMERLAIELSS